VRIQKVEGYRRIYQAECFQNEFTDIFGKDKSELEKCKDWLTTWLAILDGQGTGAIRSRQFEQLKGTDAPRLYAIRHAHSKNNERYLYVYAGILEDNESVVLLTAFKEKSATDYKTAISRATNIYTELEEYKEDGN
jgi:hypothetical protein